MTIIEINLFWLTIAPTYYWLMYALSFMIWYLIIKKRKLISEKILDDLFMYVFLGVVLWWRLWYILFYNFSEYISSPLSILKVWEWWMSFHWWVIWVIIAMLLCAKKNNINFKIVADQVVLILPIWLWLGRIWNYLNQELLWYSWYSWFLAVYKNGIWYFPSPLLEAFLEWLVLFLLLNILYIYNNKYKKWFDGQISSLFLICYWLFRILIEIFFREPDVHLWLFFWYLSMWTLLSLPMIWFWVFFYLYFKNNK